MTTALYRKYRPDTFSDVIGQEHVTEALQRALETSRVAHAFLFSGPRGCGKTTSARILARSLNCAEGPTPTPCGKCESCVELASGGPGSLDVMEIDAASNSGVEDARNLRERAEFAPVRDRYRIFILDEAHMVTSHGFNALLKLVEEPPDHVKFIFATTEPEKVITTIRSRTHHYPFRLVPPNVLVPFLKEICEREGVAVDEPVLSLVVRAGGGSVRDSLSVLDQLIAGSGDRVTLDQATRLLGFTDSALLDRAVEALGVGDGAATFAVVEEIVEAGHEPRRFVEDLLQRFRDLIVCLVAGRESAADVLEGVPADQLASMLSQADAWGIHRLSASADTVEQALRSMTGATSPRLQLELLLARLLSHGGVPTGPVAVPVAPAEPAATPQVSRAAAPEPTRLAPAEPERQAAPEPPRVQAQTPAPKAARQLAQPAEPHPTDATGAVADSGPTIDQVRAQWNAIRKGLDTRSRALSALILSTRHVYSKNGLVTFQFEGQENAERFRKNSGELALGQVLSGIFGTRLKARVGTEQELAGAQESAPVPKPDPVAAAGHAPVPAESEPRERAAPGPQQEPKPELVADYDEPPQEPPAGDDFVDDGSPVDDFQGLSPAPPVTESQEPAEPETPVEPQHSVSFHSARDSQEPTEPEVGADDSADAKYASMLPVDRVLDIIGGQVVEHTIEEPS